MADTFKFVQAQPFQLAGSGAVLGATSITLSRFYQIDGVTPLTMTDFGTIGFFTLEPNNGTQEEQGCFTGVVQNANGTATLTGISTVLFVDPYTQTSGLAKSHPGGARLVVTNTAGFYAQLVAKGDDETIAGLWTFAQFPQKSGSLTPTLAAQFTTKDYVDNIAIAGSPDATTTTKGIGKVSVAPVSPTSPIFVGDNDNRVSPVSLAALTSGEVDALAGTSGTPSSTNKYVTNDDTATAATASKLARRLGTGDITVPTTPTNATDAASKSYADSKATTYTNGIDSRAGNAGAGTQNIAHGLGVVPKKIRLTMRQVSGNSFLITSDGAYNGTTTSSAYATLFIGSATTTSGTDSTYVARLISTSGGAENRATVTMDSTNIILAWTVVSTPVNTTMQIMWEAQA